MEAHHLTDLGILMRIRSAAIAALLASSLITATPANAAPAIADDINSDLSTATNVTNSFWARNWNTFFTGTYRPPQVFGSYQRGRRLPPSCGGRQDRLRQRLYCVPGDFIAWDLGLMADGYRSGDAWVYLVIAHEWGHAVQARLQPSLVLRAQELQADCFAGAALFGAAAQKLLTFEEGTSPNSKRPCAAWATAPHGPTSATTAPPRSESPSSPAAPREASAPACPPRRGTAHRHDDLRWTFVGHDATDTIGVGRTPQSASATDRSGHRLRRPLSSVPGITDRGWHGEAFSLLFTGGFAAFVGGRGGLATVDSRRWVWRRWTRGGGGEGGSGGGTRDGGPRDGGLACPAGPAYARRTARRPAGTPPHSVYKGRAEQEQRRARTHREGQVASDSGKLSGARAARAGVFCMRE